MVLTDGRWSYRRGHLRPSRRAPKISQHSHCLTTSLRSFLSRRKRSDGDAWNPSRDQPGPDRKTNKIAFSEGNATCVSGPFSLHFHDRQTCFTSHVLSICSHHFQGPQENTEQPPQTTSFIRKKRTGPLCRPVRGKHGTCRSYLQRPAPITSLSALLSFDLIHTRKRRSGGGSGWGGTYASLSLGAAGNILTSSRNKPLNIAEKNRLREGAFLSCALFAKTEAKFHSPAPPTKGLVMQWP